MAKFVNFFLTALICLSLKSCENIFIEPDPENTAVKNFDLLWETVDKKYAFFTYKNVDWDSVYRAYRPQVYNGMSNQALFDVMDSTLFQLRDGHVNLISDFDITRYWEWYLNAPQNFDYSLLERNYLEPGYERSGPLQNKIIDSVGYIYYGSFSSSIRTVHLDYVINKFKDTKGVIIDIRNNGGGSLSNGDLLASRFADVRRPVLYEQYKNGPGHNDFTDPIEKHIGPGGPLQYTKPVVVLTNRSSYSASNDFALIMTAFPHVTLMGDTTGGGGGLPIYNELPNGWRYRFSSTFTFSPDWFNVESGIPPDVVVYMKEADRVNGEDTILEAALELLR